MTINYLQQEGFAFGNNIHFAYSINTQRFIFLHSSFQWIVSDNAHIADNEIAALTTKIEQEDILFLKNILTNVLSGKYNGKISFKLRSADGIRWLQVTPFLGENQQEQVITGNVIDVTDEVTNMQSIAKFADKKNSVLHMLGHDLRGPLNVAKSVMQVINREISDTTVLQKTGYIATILQQSIDMISDLITREFLETINVELVKKRVDIATKINDYLEECKRSAAMAEINFHLHSSSDKVYINLDEAKFMQVVNNLISNSMKFTPAGGAITISIEETEEKVHFKFSDNGIGIPKELLPEIFEKFTSARRPGLQGEPTIGLGLSIVKTIVGWHDGRISCESEEGDGTTFFISLPKDLRG